jgi:hypothetical protein
MAEENAAVGVLTIHLARTFALTWCDVLINPLCTVYAWHVFRYLNAAVRCPKCEAAFCRQRDLPAPPLDPTSLFG